VQMHAEYEARVRNETMNREGITSDASQALQDEIAVTRAENEALRNELRSMAAPYPSGNAGYLASSSHFGASRIGTTRFGADTAPVVPFRGSSSAIGGGYAPEAYPVAPSQRAVSISRTGSIRVQMNPDNDGRTTQQLPTDFSRTGVPAYDYGSRRPSGGMSIGIDAAGRTTMLEPSYLSTPEASGVVPQTLAQHGVTDSPTTAALKDRLKAVEAKFQSLKRDV
jgi:hypothetical protein